jgi:hypothetical protein
VGQRRGTILHFYNRWAMGRTLVRETNMGLFIFYFNQYRL